MLRTTRHQSSRQTNYVLVAAFCGLQWDSFHGPVPGHFVEVDALARTLRDKYNGQEDGPLTEKQESLVKEWLKDHSPSMSRVLGMSQKQAFAVLTIGHVDEKSPFGTEDHWKQLRDTFGYQGPDKIEESSLVTLTREAMYDLPGLEKWQMEQTKFGDKSLEAYSRHVQTSLKDKVHLQHCSRVTRAVQLLQRWGDPYQSSSIKAAKNELDLGGYFDSRAVEEWLPDDYRAKVFTQKDLKELDNTWKALQSDEKKFDAELASIIKEYARIRPQVAQELKKGNKARQLAEVAYRLVKSVL